MVRFLGWDGCGLPVNNCGSVPQDFYGNRGADPTTTAAGNRRGIAYDEIVQMIQRALHRQRMEHQDLDQLVDWSVRYSIDPGEWPAGVIARRLDRICSPAPLSCTEMEDLRRLLADIAGDPQPVVAEPAAIPFTDPAPIVRFLRKQFVLCGHFVSGVRDCLNELRSRGAIDRETVTADTDFLVIGALRSQEWVVNSSRCQVDAALAAGRGPLPLNQVGIISEESLLRSLNGKH